MNSTARFRLFLPIVFFILPVQIPAIEHPHMLVREHEYAALRVKSERWPWLIIKQKALYHAARLHYDPSLSFSVNAYEQVPRLAGACALAYMLDPDQRSLYVSKVQTELAAALADIRRRKGTDSDHGANVGPAHTAFIAYLTLDIMYRDLDESVRKAMEADCDYMADHHVHSWLASKFAVQGMKELYHNGRSARFDSLESEYRHHILETTTADGVFITGPGYAYSRLIMDSRVQKKIFMDVCEYQGCHHYYTNPVLINLHEWLFGYGFAPFNRSFTFGDTPPVKSLDQWSVAVLRAARFSPRAAGYASFFLGHLTDKELEGDLLHFLLCDGAPEPALAPVSRVFSQGGAWFYDDSLHQRSLAGALWNVNSSAASHTHLDVNAVHVSAYGEHVLRNAGYDGWEEPDSARWQWLHRNATSSNTVTIEGLNHRDWRGGGIREGSVGGDLEFATAGSGLALANGEHTRTLIFLKPNRGQHGYFVLADEVLSNSGLATVQLNLHANSAAEPVTVAPATEFRWPIGGCNYSGHAVGLDIFLATPAEKTDIRTGYLGSYDDCSRFQDRFLQAGYRTDAAGRCTMLTALLPFDASHPLPGARRIAAPAGTLAAIEHSASVVDYLLACEGSTALTCADFTMQGRTAIVRQRHNALQFYFLRQGRSFMQKDRRGFQSPNPVTLFMQNRHGWILSAGTEVTLYYPGIEGVRMDGSAIATIAAGKGRCTINVPAGRHQLEIISRHAE